MRVSIVRAVGAGVLLLALTAPTVAAVGRVAITLDSNFVTGVETFTANGPFCDSGTAETPWIFFAGSDHSRAGSFHLAKILTCDGGSGTLTIRVDAATVFGSPIDQGGWSVESGTGDYAGASGGGMLLGNYYDEGVVDHYTGVLQD
jgi:hypothetical protein